MSVRQHQERPGLAERFFVGDSQRKHSSDTGLPPSRMLGTEAGTR